MAITKEQDKPPRILITGASGQYGRLVIDKLLTQARLPASSLLLLTRDPTKLASYAAQGAVVRQGSFDDPVAVLAAAFRGAHTMLLISATRVGQRVPQHQAAVDAAVRAGVSHIVYTSIISAHLAVPTALVGEEHVATEAMLKASGVHWTALRDAQYAEAMTDVAGPPALQAGVLRANAGDGRMAFVGRDDCAAAAVAVLADPVPHRNKAYSITGPDLLSWGEAAQILGEAAAVTSHQPLRYEALTDEEQLAVFDAMGIPREAVDYNVVGGYPWTSSDMASFTKATRLGEMAILSDDVELLTGRKPKSFRQICQERLGKKQEV